MRLWYETEGAYLTLPLELGADWTHKAACLPFRADILRHYILMLPDGGHTLWSPMEVEIFAVTSNAKAVFYSCHNELPKILVWVPR